MNKGQTTNKVCVLYLPNQIRFSIERGRVGEKSLGRTKLPIFLGKQQLSIRTWSGLVCQKSAIMAKSENSKI